MKLNNLNNKIIWYNINKEGYINKHLENKPAIYIYMKNSLSNNEFNCYIGSTINLSARISSHRCQINNFNNYKYTNKRTLFYELIIKHGWENFQFGILEYIDLSFVKDIKQKKEIILEKEQYYLNNINPSLNSYKKATSSLGVKRSLAFSIKMSKIRRGKSIRSNKKINNTIRIITEETKSKISLKNQGINVKVFDKLNNLINEFASIRSTAKFFNVHPKTINNIYKTGKSFDEFIYKFELKDNRISIYDINKNIIDTFDNSKKVSIHYNIPSSTLSDYIKSNKLYKNKFYFSKHA